MPVRIVQKKKREIADQDHEPQTDSNSISNDTSSAHQNINDNDIKLTVSGLEAYLQQQEKHLIIAALKQTDGNKTQAAELLGTSFRSLRYRMKKLEIDED